MLRRRPFIPMLISNALSGLLVGIGVLVTRNLTPAQSEPPMDNLMVDRELVLVPNPEHPLNNSMGFRGKEFEIEKAPGITRIAFFGDSSTYTTHEPGYVERLGERYPDRCETINAASPAYDILDILVRYERDVLPLDPDVIILALPGAHAVRRRPSIGVDLLAFGLQHIADLAADREQEVYILDMPMNWGGDNPGTVRWGIAEPIVIEAYLEDLRGVMRESGIQVLDARVLNLPASLFYDELHLVDEGHRRLAEWLDQRVFAEMCTD